MSTSELNASVKQLRELRRMADELTAEIETITDALKKEMDARGVDELSGVDWRATWKSVQSSRIDTAALRRACPDIAEAFTRPTSVKRFYLA